jgi:hypothetical protein
MEVEDVKLQLCRVLRKGRRDLSANGRSHGLERRSSRIPAGESPGGTGPDCIGMPPMPLPPVKQWGVLPKSKTGEKRCRTGPMSHEFVNRSRFG